MSQALTSPTGDPPHARDPAGELTGVSRLALVGLIAVGLAGCEDATAPKQVVEATAASAPALALGTTASPDRVAAAEEALRDAAQRIVPSLADEERAAKVGLALNALSTRLATADPRITKLALDATRAALDAYQSQLSSAAAEAPELDAIRLALDMVEDLLLTTAAE